MEHPNAAPILQTGQSFIVSTDINMRILPQILVVLCVSVTLVSGDRTRGGNGGIRGREIGVPADEDTLGGVPLRRALKKMKGKKKKNVFERDQKVSSSNSNSEETHGRHSQRFSRSAPNTGRVGERDGLQPSPAPSIPPPSLASVKLATEREKYGALRRVTDPPTDLPTLSPDQQAATGGEENTNESSTTTDSDKAEGGGDEDKAGRQSGVDCSLNANGFFGEPTGSVYEIDFLYQVYVNAGTSLSVLRMQVMDELDVAVAESILPSFFNCNDSRRGRRDLQNGVIEAVSSRRPDEVVLGGLSCTGRAYPGVGCYVVQGYVSVFGTGFRNLQDVKDTVIPVVRAAIDNGALQRASSVVVNVNAIGDDLATLGPLLTVSPVVSPPTPAPVPGQQPTSPGQPTSPNPPVLPPTGGGTVAPSISLSPSFGATPEPTSAPTNTYKPTTTWYPTVTTSPSASSGNGGIPTSQPPSSRVRSVTPDESGIEKMDWWHWLLVGVGAAVLLMCGLGLLRGPDGEYGKKRPRSDDDGINAVGSPSNVVKPKNSSTANDRGDDYVPPGMDNKTEDSGVGTFSITPGEPQGYGSNVMEDDDDDEDPSEEEEDMQYYEDDGDDDQDEDMGYEDQQDEGYDDDQPDMGYGDDQPDMGYGQQDQHDDGDDQYGDEYAGDQQEYDDGDDYEGEPQDYEDGGDYGEEDDDYEDVEETYYEEEEETVSDSGGQAAEAGWEDQYAVNR